MFCLFCLRCCSLRTDHAGEMHDNNGELTCLQCMCWHNIRFSQLSNCGMWGNVSRHLSRGYNAEESIAWASLVCLFKISLHCCYLLCCTFSLVFQQTTTVDYVTDTSLSCGSFAIDMVLPLMGLNQLIGPLGNLLHWKKGYSSCAGVWNMNLRRGGGEMQEAVVAPPWWSCTWQCPLMTDKTRSRPLLYSRVFVCGKAGTSLKHWAKVAKNLYAFWLWNNST